MDTENNFTSRRLTLKPPSMGRLIALSGRHDENIEMVAKHLEVDIRNRGHDFEVSGHPQMVDSAISVLARLYQKTENQREIEKEDVHLELYSQPAVISAKTIVLKTPLKTIYPRNNTQKQYLERIHQHDVNFGIGPAGTGKTYLAVACAVNALEKEWVKRIILVRPAVEAGERLGFLPGDMAQKVDPYLRPVYDALYDMMGIERVERLLEKHIIEVAPLAFMRGRTLNEAFIILDEAQNTTREQMKMFLTRMGFGSKIVTTGDVTQVDIANPQRSGLLHAMALFKNSDGISFTEFTSQDVIRHPMVQKIITLYEQAEDQAP